MTALPQFLVVALGLLIAKVVAATGATKTCAHEIFDYFMSF